MSPGARGAGRFGHPVRIRELGLFSADELVRAATSAVRAELPWIDIRLLPSPRALSLLRCHGAMALVLDDTGLVLADTDRIRAAVRDLRIVLLSFNDLVQCSPPGVARDALPYTVKADLVFAANRTDLAPATIIASVVRAAEDDLDVAALRGPRRPILLLVDDEPRWLSQFLPVLYPIIGRRVAVKIARTYEQAVHFLLGASDEAGVAEAGVARGRGRDVVCLVADMVFPRGGHVSSDAGRALVALFARRFPGLPIIIASKSPEAAALSGAGLVVPKGDPGSLGLLARHLRRESVRWRQLPRRASRLSRG